MNRAIVLGGLLVLATACAPDAADEEVASSADAILEPSGNWVVYPMPLNPAQEISGPGGSFVGRASSIFYLRVSGLLPNRTFGAHLHKLACNDTQGGGHYQRDPKAGPTADNEVWLDFTTDADGSGGSSKFVPFAISAAQAKSIVIHEKGTNPVDGKAGAKLACIDLAIGSRSRLLGN